MHTKFKCEKAVVKLLEKKGIEAYAPVQKKARVRSGKVRYHEIPLISCYVFVNIVRKDYVTVLETEHISSFIKMTGELMPIPESSMQLLKRIVGEEGLEVQTEYVSSIREGDFVTITKGSMAGIQGKIVRQANKRFFEIEIENLGYDLLISVDGSFLEKTGLYLGTL